MHTREEVTAAKRVSLLQLLPADAKLISKGNGRYMTLCQFHDEKTPSMSLVKYDDGCWGYRCFGCGASGDPIRYLQKTKGMDFVDAVKELLQSAKTAPERPQVVDTYRYLDKDGKLAYEVLRYSPKNFRMRRPTDQGWSWCLDGLGRVLYQLPVLLSATGDIFYVEGEKDVKCLSSHNLTATTHAGGAGSYKTELLQQLPVVPGRRVIVVPDRDEPGMKMMRRIFADGRSLGHDMHFLLLPQGKDSTEFFELGGTLEQFLSEVK